MAGTNPIVSLTASQTFTRCSETSLTQQPEVDLGSSLPLVAYWTEAIEAVKNLPDSVAAFKHDLAAKKGGPFPLSITTLDKQKILYLPEEEPDDFEKYKVTFGIILELAHIGNLKPVPTGRNNISAFWATLEENKDSIYGFYLCIKRDQLTLTDNVPKALKPGWDFAAWLLWSASTGDQTGMAFTRVKRVVSIMPGEKTSARNQGKSTDTDRMALFLRTVAMENPDKVSNFKKLLKSKEFIIGSFIGKKPVRGSYTKDEFVVVTEVWDAKRKALELAYDTMPVGYRECMERTPPLKLSTYFSGFNIKNSEKVKAIQWSQPRHGIWKQ